MCVWIHTVICAYSISDEPMCELCVTFVEHSKMPEHKTLCLHSDQDSRRMLGGGEAGRHQVQVTSRCSIKGHADEPCGPAAN